MGSYKVAVVGAGPAGIYASDILSKSGLDVDIDLFEALPAPYGLVRYGVAPDHPRIKQIIDALHGILSRGDIRLIGNVKIGEDVSLDALKEHYHAIILATGSNADMPLNIPGIDADGSYGAADFVYWYDGHPDHSREWPLNAKEIAVLGVGNVALDVARVLAKLPEDMEVTEIPDNVAAGLRHSPVTDVHVFGRRGPAQVKFSPLELRELGRQNGVDVLVSEEDFDFDKASEEAINSSNQLKQVVKALTAYALIPESEHTGSRRIHIHLFQRPVEIETDADGKVCALKTERTRLTGDGNVEGTGEFVTTPVQAVYRAVGYYGARVPGAPFDEARGVIPNIAGRVVTEADGEAPVDRLYVTGWAKRGPVGLIGSTKSDAQETIANLVTDAGAGKLAGERAGDGLALVEAAGIKYTTWEGWELLDAYERELGKKYDPPRERVKVVSRDAMTAISRGESDIPELI